MKFTKQISGNLIPNLITQDLNFENLQGNGGIKNFAGKFLQISVSSKE